MPDGVTPTQEPQAQSPAPASQPQLSLESATDFLLSRLEQPSQNVADPAVKTPADDPAKEGEPAAGEPEPEFLEWQEGEETRRVPLSEALDALTNVKDSERQLAEMRTQQEQMPLEIEQGILQLAQARQGAINEMMQFQQHYVPQQPSRVLLDENSEHYNPGQFAAQLAEYERGVNYLNQVKQHEAEQRQIHAQEQATLQRAAQSRVTQHLKTAWPEVLTDQQTRQDLVQLMQHVGFDPGKDLQSVTDPRVFSVLKYAMRGLQAESQAKGTLKAVRSAPRLVRGTGKTNAAQQANGDAMNRLQKSGSINDAVEFMLSRG